MSSRCASGTYPQQCSALRKNGHVIIGGRPCKIVEMSTSKTGKHGHAKVHLVALDIFTGQKCEDICPSTHNMNVPNVKRVDYQVIDYEDNHLHLMDDKGETFQIKVDPETNSQQKELIELFEAGEQLMATVLSACEEEMVVGWKALKD